MKAITDKAKQLFGLLQTQEISNKVQLLEVCSEVAKNQLKRDTLMLQMDAEMQIIKDKYGAQIEQANAVIDHDVKRLKSWAAANRETKFGGRQSYIIGGHIFEYRKGTGAVKCGEELKEDDIVDRIMALHEEQLDGTSYAPDQVKALLLRVEAELNKDAVKREFRLGTLKPLLEQLGLKVVVTESFTFTPAREELPSIAETSAVRGKEAA